MGDFIEEFNYNKSKESYNISELKQILLDYFREHVSSISDMNSFSANLSTFAEFAYDDLRRLYKLVICACCNKYGIDKGTLKILDVGQYKLLMPHDIFITDISFIKYEDGSNINTIYELSNIADDLILKFNIDIKNICENEFYSYRKDPNRNDIESVIKQLK